MHDTSSDLESFVFKFAILNALLSKSIKNVLMWNMGEMLCYATQTTCLRHNHPVLLNKFACRLCNVKLLLLTDLLICFFSFLNFSYFVFI